MAEALAREKLAQRGWSGVEVRSAGVAAIPGGRPSEGAVRVAGRQGIELAEHRSTPLDARLVGQADLILTMSPGHLEAVHYLEGGDRAAVITGFAAGQEGRGTEERGSTPGVADPFGGDDEAYEAAFRQLDELLEAVLDRIAPVVAP